MLRGDEGAVVRCRRGFRGQTDGEGDWRSHLGVCDGDCEVGGCLCDMAGVGREEGEELLEQVDVAL